MKKRKYAIVLAMIMLSLTACGDNDGNDSSRRLRKNRTENNTGDSSENLQESSATEGNETDITVTGNGDNSNYKPLHIYMESHQAGTSVDGMTSSYCTYCSPYLCEDDAAMYPELDKSLRSIADSNKDNEEEYARYLGELWKDEYQNNENVSSFFSESTAKVVRADTQVVSILEYDSEYTGGVHDMYGYIAYNFDTDTGKEIKFTDVVKDCDMFFEVVDRKIKEEYPDISDNLLSASEFIKEQDNAYDCFTWTVGSEGVTVYFNPYILGSFADGAQIIEVCYNENPLLFDDKYSKCCKDYVTPINRGEIFHVDADGDGILEGYTLQYEYIDDYSINFTILRDDMEEIYIDDCSYGEDSYLIRRDGKYYIWMIETSDNDYSVLRVLNLEEMSLNKDYYENAYPTVDPSIANAFGYENEEDYYSSYSLNASFTDPDSVWLEQTLYVFSTLCGKKEYKVGADGYPESADELYIVPNSPLLRVKLDLECDIVDEDGNVTGTSVIPEGSIVRIIRTDGAKYDDMQIMNPDIVTVEESDGYVYIYTDEMPEINSNDDIYRVYMHFEEGDRTVNDLDKTEYEVFDGMIYAG